MSHSPGPIGYGRPARLESALLQRKVKALRVRLNETEDLVLELQASLTAIHHSNNKVACDISLLRQCKPSASWVSLCGGDVQQLVIDAAKGVAVSISSDFNKQMDLTLYSCMNELRQR